jgi:hypothetical protein
MPTNGHTSGVKTLGSDETNTGRRQRRRRMGPVGRACATNWLRGEELNLRADGWSCEEPDHLLFDRTTLHERLRNRSLILVRDRATGLVRATVFLASLLAGRVRKDARCRWQPERRDKRRQHDCKQDRGCVPHELMGSTRKTRCRTSLNALRTAWSGEAHPKQNALGLSAREKTIDATPAS